MASRSKVEELLSRYNHVCRQIKDERKALRKAKRKAVDTEKALEIVRSVAIRVQEEAHKQIAEIVTKCIRAVYPDEPYEFRIVFEKKRNKTEARLAFFKDGVEEHPKEGSGGGVLDVAAFALQISCMMLYRPKRRRLFVADEPFKNVNGAANRKRAAIMVETLAEELGLQIIIVTGYDWLSIGKVIDLDMGKGG